MSPHGFISMPSVSACKQQKSRDLRSRPPVFLLDTRLSTTTVCGPRLWDWALPQGSRKQPRYLVSILPQECWIRQTPHADTCSFKRMQVQSDAKIIWAEEKFAPESMTQFHHRSEDHVMSDEDRHRARINLNILNYFVESDSTTKRNETLILVL